MRLKFPNKVLTALIQVSDAPFIEGLDSFLPKNSRDDLACACPAGAVGAPIN